MLLKVIQKYSIYYIEYVTIKDLKYIKINSVNPLYLIVSKVNGYFEEINKNKYLTLDFQWKQRNNKSMKNCRVKSDIWLGYV